MKLTSAKLLFLDCQTSGLSAHQAEVLELGWAFGKKAPHTALIRPEAIEEVSKKVWKITGLSLTDFTDDKTRDLRVVWKEIVDKATVSGVVAVVIHYAAFEMGFLRSVHEEVYEGAEFPWPVICSYRLAGRLCREMPACTLRALSGYLGHVLPPSQRSLDHVAATQKVWQFLVERWQTESGLSTWQEFYEWWEKPAQAAPKGDQKSKKIARTYAVPPEVRKGLPLGPGVYEMRSGDGTLLYIGKATSLRSRVASYFQRRKGDRQRLPELMTQVRDIQVIETATPLEAALLETDRIKEFEPHYNTALRRNDRRVVYFGWDFESVGESWEARFPLGPFLYEEAFESVRLLMRVLRGKTDALDEHMLGHPAQNVRPILESVLRELGVQDLESVNAYRLWRLGKTLPPEVKDEVMEEGVEEAETDEEAEVNLTPEQEAEQIRASVLRKLRRPASGLHQANWMAWLRECRVSWQLENETWRYLVFSEGRAVEQGSVEQFELLPAYERPRRSIRERRAAFTVTDFDRLRVLKTELGILAKQVPVRVEFSRTRRLENSLLGTTWLSRALSRTLLA